MNAALVMTSIGSPNEVMRIFAEQCAQHHVEFILIGDKKSPQDFKFQGCRFVSIDEQKQLQFQLAKLLPENHYSRKNIGYLLAKKYDSIVETDDDNYPIENFWQKPSINNYRFLEATGWINAYQYFTKDVIWPRGYPLDKVTTQIPPLKGVRGMFNPKIHQGLADENPDVDALYRIAFKLPFYFEAAEPLLLQNNQWCPFNSQNTTWQKDVFMLLYLPSYCSFRMTDIWRSFIAQRILWTCDWSIAFHNADVIQKRNYHDLVADFKDELPGYIDNDRIKNLLQKLELKTGQKSIADNLLTCYRALITEKIFPPEELPLLEAWIADMSW